MQNQFIEELRKKAEKTEENKETLYKENLKQEYPWISKESVEDKFVEHTLKRMFNLKEGEER